MSTAAPVAPSPTAVGYHEIPLDKIRTSPLNPRKGPGDVTDLAASIAAAGIIEPLIVRPAGMVGGEADSFEIVAGARRYTAARQVGLLLVPCLVRELTDAQLLTVALIENNQRHDVHPMQEAEALRKLSRLDRANTPEVLATNIGRPLAYVRNRLRLLDLVEDVRAAFAADRITIGHAERIARLAEDLQPAALAACFHPLYGHDTETEILRPVHDLEAWIKARTVIDPKSAHVQEALPELVEQVERAEAEGATLAQLSTAFKPEHGLKGKAAPLPASKWRQVGAKACAHVTRGVVVYGDQHRAEILTVCLKTSKCPTHWPPPPETTADAPAAEPAWKQREAERRKEREAWETQHSAVLAAVAAHLKGRKADVPLAHVVLGALGQEANEVHEHIGKVTPQNVGHVLWFVEALRCGMWDKAEWAREIKALCGFDLAKWEKAQAKGTAAPVAAKPAKARAEKPAAKKGKKR